MAHEKDIPYRNKYAYVERVREGSRIKFNVYNPNGSLCYAFTDKKIAIKFAKNLEKCSLLWDKETNKKLFSEDD